MYASLNQKAEIEYQKKVCKAVGLNKFLLSVAKGEVLVRAPTSSVAIWRTNMKRLDMKNTRALIPAGPRGNHDQKSSLCEPSQMALFRPMARDRRAAWTNLECNEEVKNRRYGRGGGILGAGVDMIAVYRRMG